MAFVPLPSGTAHPVARQIRVEARTFAFDPHRIRVRQGDRVVIELASTDVVHGLYVDGYDVQTTTAPGVPGQLAFVADRAGKFRFRCSVTCGTLHPFMIGELVVEPNLPFWRAAALTLIAAIGTLAILAVRSTEEDKT
jgi:cytochrome c oxidase subunit 2